MHLDRCLDYLGCGRLEQLVRARCLEQQFKVAGLVKYDLFDDQHTTPAGRITILDQLDLFQEKAFKSEETILEISGTVR